MLVVQYTESLGNDFVIIDGVTQFFEPSSKEISKILNFDHDFSIDQVMVILPPSDSRFDFQIKESKKIYIMSYFSIKLFENLRIAFTIDHVVITFGIFFNLIPIVFLFSKVILKVQMV